MITTKKPFKHAGQSCPTVVIPSKDPVPATYRNKPLDSTVAKTKRIPRGGFIMPNEAGKPFTFKSPRKVYVRTGTGTIGLITGRQPWRNKSERRLVLKARRLDREQAAANLNGGAK